MTLHYHDPLTGKMGRYWVAPIACASFHEQMAAWGFVRIDPSILWYEI